MTSVGIPLGEVVNQSEVAPPGACDRGTSFGFFGSSSGAFPAALMFMNLLRRSNQNGAPRDRARVVIAIGHRSSTRAPQLWQRWPFVRRLIAGDDAGAAGECGERDERRVRRTNGESHSKHKTLTACRNFLTRRTFADNHEIRFCRQSCSSRRFSPRRSTSGSRVDADGPGGIPARRMSDGFSFARRALGNR